MSDVYLVWSNEHDGWWGPNERGYTRTLDAAGRYSRAAAIRICKHALPTAMHIGRIAEIPVSLADIEEVLAGAAVPRKNEAKLAFAYELQGFVAAMAHGEPLPTVLKKIAELIVLIAKANGLTEDDL